MTYYHLGRMFRVSCSHGQGQRWGLTKVGVNASRQPEAAKVEKKNGWLRSSGSLLESFEKPPQSTVHVRRTEQSRQIVAHASPFLSCDAGSWPPTAAHVVLVPREGRPILPRCRTNRTTRGADAPTLADRRCSVSAHARPIGATAGTLPFEPVPLVQRLEPGSAGTVTSCSSFVADENADRAVCFSALCGMLSAGISVDGVAGHRSMWEPDPKIHFSIEPWALSRRHPRRPPTAAPPLRHR